MVVIAWFDVLVSSRELLGIGEVVVVEESVKLVESGGGDAPCSAEEQPVRTEKDEIPTNCIKCRRVN